ncbi:MAG: universal stress protein [Hyphomicrobiaceae bacterium]
MYKHILVATDGSELSTKAVANGIRLANAPGALVTVLTVAVTRAPVMIEGVLVGPSDEATRILHAASTEAHQTGATCQTVVVIDREPYRAIIDTAHSRAYDLIVMASHGRRGYTALLLGSETHKVLAHSTIPVLVHR